MPPICSMRAESALRTNAHSRVYSPIVIVDGSASKLTICGSPRALERCRSVLGVAIGAAASKRGACGVGRGAAACAACSGGRAAGAAAAGAAGCSAARCCCGGAFAWVGAVAAEDVPWRAARTRGGGRPALTGEVRAGERAGLIALARRRLDLARSRGWSRGTASARLR